MMDLGEKNIFPPPPAGRYVTPIRQCGVISRIGYGTTDKYPA